MSILMVEWIRHLNPLIGIWFACSANEICGTESRCAKLEANSLLTRSRKGLNRRSDSLPRAWQNCSETIGGYIDHSIFN